MSCRLWRLHTRNKTEKREERKNKNRENQRGRDNRSWKNKDGQEEQMEIITKKINEIKPYKNNPRKNDDAVEYVANSIREFGFKVL